MRITISSTLPIRREDLLKIVEAPRVVRVGRIHDDSLKSFHEDFDAAACQPQPVIPLIIDSPGGSVDTLLHLLDLCRTATKPVATIVLGKAMSAGVVLASAGWHGYRFAGPLARYMIHDVAGTTGGKAEEMVADAHEVQRLNELLYGILADHSRMPPRHFWDLVQARGRSDWFLTAQEAQQHGLVDHLRVPELRYHIMGHMELA